MRRPRTSVSHWSAEIPGQTDLQSKFEAGAGVLADLVERLRCHVDEGGDGLKLRLC